MYKIMKHILGIRVVVQFIALNVIEDALKVPLTGNECPRSFE